jgi:hypothetical protein
MVCRATLTGLFLLSLIGFHARPALSQGEKTFLIDTVDSAGDVGQFASVVVDAMGKVWIAYVEYRGPFNLELRLASGGPGNWDIESVPVPSGSCQPSRVALDQDGSPGIVCGESLMDYIHKVGDTWQSEEIGYSGPPLRWRYSYDSALATSPGGTTVAASVQTVEIHHQDFYVTIVVADRREGSWDVTEFGRLTYALKPPYNTGIAVDGNDDLHVGIVPSINQPFQYFHRALGGWSSQIVPGITSDFAIAVDAQDTPLVTYANDAGLWLARKGGAVWNHFLIASDSAVSGPDVVVDKGNVIHVKYNSSTEVRYATNETGAWQTWFVDGPGAGGGGIAVDANGIPHFAYQDLLMEDLRYAKLTGSTPIKKQTWGAIKSRYRK